MSKREEYEHLVRRSMEFYDTALMQIERGFYSLAAFSLEQSLQLFLKAQLLKHGCGYPRTHDVRRLLELLAEVSGRSELRELVSKHLLELASLEDAYITSRYVLREFRKEEVLKLKRAVDEVMRTVG